MSVYVNKFVGRKQSLAEALPCLSLVALPLLFDAADERQCLIDFNRRSRPCQSPLISLTDASRIVSTGKPQQAVSHLAAVLQHDRAIHHKQRLRGDHS